MNIFLLDLDMQKNAAYLVDRHVVKMITEQNQLLCSAFYFTGEIPEGIYKLTHANHPCAVWTRASLSNWLWLRDMTLALCAEYTFRYGKTHKGEGVCLSLPMPKLPDNGRTPFAQAVPEEYRDADAVQAYRRYYNAEKRGLFQWKNRPAPDWIEW